MAEESSNDQKTEDPTAHRLQKALEDGQLAFSSELTSGLAVLAGVLFFLFFGDWFFRTIKHNIYQRLSEFQPMIEDKNAILNMIKLDVTRIGMLGFVFMGTVMAVGLTTSFLQTRFNISFKPLELKWNKLDPIAGIKRMFSLRAVMRGLVAIAKTTAICVAVWFLTASKLNRLADAPFWTIGTIVHMCVTLILNIGLVTAILMVVIGALDYAFQYWKRIQDLKMTKQEVKDEHKNVEGDPLIRARIRRLQNERAKQRTIQEVPEATVLITNPTHYAVALKYDPEQHSAPVVIAKGQDHLALKMIEVAKANDVPVVERKPLARFMFAHIDVGQAIPPELFHSVAEILNFIRSAGRAA